MPDSRPDLIFDLDGTLIDSAPDIAHALNHLLGELGLRSLDIATVRSLVGDGAPELMRKALAMAGRVVEPADIPPLFERYRAYYLEHAIRLTRPYPGVPETLAALRASGHRMAVCTNKIQKPTLKILDGLGLARYFDGVVGGDVTPARKPDPRHLLAALALIDGAPNKAVMIGDGINDALAAKAAGIPLLILDSGYGEIAARDLGGDLLLESFSEIPGALRRLNG
ncbi:MAG TPA: phosphoglycolate phosphatase [Candidatus Polarisedimenticolia bacterium]|nr:phosphoglycolate phosphatase [Candidatus Polarisedimenticolia bacterium]